MKTVYVLVFLAWVSPPVPEEDKAIERSSTFGDRLTLEQCEAERVRIVNSIHEQMKGNILAYCFPRKVKE